MTMDRSEKNLWAMTGPEKSMLVRRLAERVAELEVQAHNRNEHISDLESRVRELEAENGNLDD
jgi:hypothetical protein